MGLLLLPLCLSACLFRKLGGDFSGPPAELRSALEPAALAFLDENLADLDPAQLHDYHTHVVGLGAGGTGASVNPDMLSWWHPVSRAKFSIFSSACGIDDREAADSQFLARLNDLIDHGHPGGRFALLAFDQTYREDGSLDLEHTGFHVPNDYVFEIAEQHAERFEPVMSVHPYRADAIVELERCAARGARRIKWLPNAMGIDPASPLCDPFYERMRELGIALLSHAGQETTVDGAETQAFGNPLRLRRALDHGVKVVVAHCAAAGKGEDLDDPDGGSVPNFELFLRLMDEPRYDGLVFGEISAVTAVNMDLVVIETLLRRTDLHPRLVNGSDYPVPAVNCVIWLRRLATRGLITREQRRWLGDIYHYNPLTFDLALKRAVRHPETGERFPDSVFYRHPSL